MINKIISITLCCFAGALVFSTSATAQEKTAKACAEEWRANKADNQAKKITEKAYVAQCRTGSAATVSTTPGPATPQPKAGTDQKTAKACAEEWRANKADNQAKKITEKEYVTQCRAGAAPSRPAAVTPIQTPPATTTKPADSARTAAPARSTTAPPAAPTGAGQYSTEAQAKLMCLTDTVVWVNLKSKIYHFSGHKDYGNTKSGAYMCQKNADAAGTRAAKNEKR